MAVKKMSKVEPKREPAIRPGSTVEDLKNFDYFNCPESSNIKMAAYWKAERQLDITFKDTAGRSKSVYTYDDVPAEVWEQFKTAESKGTFFAANIRGKYNTEKI